MNTGHRPIRMLPAPTFFRVYTPELGRFIQPDMIMPGVTNPQAWNRFRYTHNSPVNLSDPSGHERDCGIGDQYCDSLQHELGANWKEGVNQSSKKSICKKNQKPYFLPNESIEITDAYTIGWENFGTAWNIYWNPNSSIIQRAQAELYLAAWGGVHYAAAIGVGLIAYGVWQLAVSGAGACGLNPQCESKLSITAQDIAKQTIDGWIMNGKNIQQDIK